MEGQRKPYYGCISNDTLSGMSEETGMDIIKGMVQEIGESSVKQKSVKKVRHGNRVGKKTLRIVEVPNDVEVVVSSLNNEKEVMKVVKEE
ncbi:unnamed protein product [Lathyrus oleraceus]